MWDGSSNGESIQNGEPNSFSTKKRERSVSISALLVVVAGRLFVVACVVRSGIWSE